MKMYIFSKFGCHECVPMTLQAIEDVNSTVTADNQEEPRSASDSCCDSSPETPF